MLPALKLLYSRRVVNINVNIVVAGLLALALTIIPVSLTRLVGIENELTIVAVTFVADLVFDVVIFYGLHWVANRRAAILAAARHGGNAKFNFFKEATWVQFERALISPVLYLVALGTQYLLLVADVPRELATLIGFCCGIAVARAIHTAWMLRPSTRAQMLAVGRPDLEATDDLGGLPPGPRRLIRRRRDRSGETDDSMSPADPRASGADAGSR